MRPHEVNYLNNFIMGWYSDDTTYCDDLIKLHDSSETSKVEGVSRLNDKVYVDKNIKESIDSSYFPHMMDRLEYAHVLNQCIESYDRKYPESFCCGYHLEENFLIQRYPSGGGYKVYHCERGSARMPSVSRHLVFMTYLNDVTDGGQTEFLYQKTKINAVKGLTLIWPADWTFTHRGVVSPSQEKYIITGWLNLR